jgi:hypothetical protein
MRQVSARENYFSFPTAEHVAEISARGRKLIALKDLAGFWKSLKPF